MPGAHAVDGRLRLVAAGGDPVDPSPAGIFRAYGCRAPDGVALEAAVAGGAPADFAFDRRHAEPTPLRARGRDVSVAGDDFGRRNLSWTPADGASLAAMTYGLSQAELVALAESLLAGDATQVVPRSRSGSSRSARERCPEGPPVVSQSTWCRPPVTWDHPELSFASSMGPPLRQ